MPDKDRAVVRPQPDHEWKYAQSRFDHLPKIPFRTLLSGKSASGKGVLMVNAVTNFYRKCFKRIFVFASTVEVDSTFKAIEHYAIRELQQVKAQFMYDSFNEKALEQIIVAQTKDIQRQKDDPDRKGPLKGCLIVVDDLSHDGALRRMQGGVSSRLWTVARHYGISLWCNVHSINSLGSLARRQASCVVVFPIANYKEKETIREMYGQLAGSLKKFDEILDVATGPNAEPYSFLTIHTGGKTFKKTFMLRFEAYLEPESDSE